MLVIFEGQRSTGKSTIIDLVARKLLRKGYDVKQLKLTRSQSPVVVMKAVMPPAALSELSEITLMDRAHVSEMVYSMHTGRDITYEPQELLDLDEELSTMDTLMIFLDCSTKILIERMKFDNKEPEGDIEAIGTLFHQVVGQTNIQTAFVDNTYLTLDETVEFVYMIIYHFMMMKTRIEREMPK